MKKDQFAFLMGGLAFGILFGFGLFWAYGNRPTPGGRAENGEVPATRGPMAPTQAPMGGAPPAAGGGAPMVARVQELKRAIQANPALLEPHMELAHLYHDAGMWKEAIAVYEKAVELAPRNPDLLTDLGVCFQEDNQLERALESFRRAQESSPAHWQSLYNIVVVAGFGLGRLDEAQQALDRLAQVNPGAPNLDRLREGLAKAKQGSPG